ncbi:MAG: hypothetical protein B2I17_01670 [Thermoplasmatales archaeon B_DKE]|nr:MAG: hypothetical protein B2I17_01670 [Thermoplasmatales archaeon B_DKE]
MERHSPGYINAYILNLMVHSDTLAMDEQDIRDRIEKRFKQSRNRRIRPQNVRKFHIEPLIERRWLREVEGKYERVGRLDHVRPEQTLRDQYERFNKGDIERIIYQQEFNRKHFGSEDFEGTLTEQEFNEYMEKIYGPVVEMLRKEKEEIKEFMKEFNREV